MAEYTVSLQELIPHLTRKLKQLQKGTIEGVERTAEDLAEVIKDNVPVAFSELKDSIDVEITPNNIKVIASAPHAAAVEVGSRPHTPPIEPLLKWVKLRGMQGLTKRGKIRKPLKVAKNGPSPRQLGRIQARHVATALQSYVREGAMDISGPLEIARKIQRAISVSGTRPYHYIQKSLSKVKYHLDKNIRIELENNS